MAQVTVPEQFRPAARGLAYPPHQTGPLIEERFYEFYLRHRDQFPPEPVYRPVIWTNYYVNHDDGRRQLRQLQEFLDTACARETSYFTVIQHADGIMNYLRPEQVTTFAAGGTGDIPIPLLCDPHTPADRPRDVFASFIDMPTHYCRRRLFDLARRDARFIVTSTDDIARTLPVFEDLTRRSVFALSAPPSRPVSGPAPVWRNGTRRRCGAGRRTGEARGVRPHRCASASLARRTGRRRRAPISGRPPCYVGQDGRRASRTRESAHWSGSRCPR